MTTTTGRDAYAEAGVDIEAGADAVRRIAPHLHRTARREVVSLPGGFAGGFAIDPTKWREPVLVSGTDGVGTKLLVAATLGRWTTIGVDAVAMCVNDIAVTGAEPLYFLDYLATGQADPAVVADIVSGVADGCAEAGCSLLGGETAEMPGMYAPGHADIAGFAVGIVERDQVPDPRTMCPGDVVVGIASSGLHSNGYSLVRQVLLEGAEGEDARELLAARPPELGGRTLGDELLEPTRIYTQHARALVEHCRIRALAHITGGGFFENIGRVVPDHVDVVVDAGSWHEPAVFDLVCRRGDLDGRTMHRVFNMGIGLVAIVPPADAALAIDVARAAGSRAWRIGRVVTGSGEVHVEDAR